MANNNGEGLVATYIKHSTHLLNHPELTPYPVEQSITTQRVPSILSRELIALSVLLIIAIGIIFYLVTKTPLNNQELTIFVRDSHNNPALVNQGKITVNTKGHVPFIRAIEQDRIVDFSEVNLGHHQSNCCRGRWS